MIKEAKRSDRDVLVKLIRDSFRDVAQRFALTKDNCPKHPSNYTLSWIESDISRGAQYYILYVDKNPSGCVAIEKPSADICYIKRLSILPKMRGKHFGIRLVQHALKCAASKGASKVSIGIINEQTELKEWYKQLRFVETQIKSFPHLPFRICLMEFELEKPANNAFDKEELIKEIVEKEWQMFQNVKNIGGKADCQQDYATFSIHRASQAESCSLETLMSYLEDLEKAKQSDRNLLSEKYARMMASTSPEYYAQIESRLPPLEDTLVEIVERIVQIVLVWEQALIERYPNLIQRGRPLFSSEDTQQVTSVETYLKGELLTYSMKTLQLYLNNVMFQKEKAINGPELILKSVVKRHGYPSLEAANEAMGAGSTTLE